MCRLSSALSLALLLASGCGGPFGGLGLGECGPRAPAKANEVNFEGGGIDTAGRAVIRLAFVQQGSCVAAEERWVRWDPAARRLEATAPAAGERLQESEGVGLPDAAGLRWERLQVKAVVSWPEESRTPARVRFTTDEGLVAEATCDAATGALLCTVAQ